MNEKEWEESGHGLPEVRSFLFIGGTEENHG